MNATNLFEYPPHIAYSGAYLTGFEVLAVDGAIGTVETACYDGGRSWFLVDTDFWIFGERRLLPAGTARGVTCNARRLFIGLTKDEVRNAPDYDEEQHREDEPTYLNALGRYYAPWAPLYNPAPADFMVPLEFHSAKQQHGH